MKEAITTPTDLFYDQLRDLASVEAQVAKTLPHLAELASRPDLCAYFGEQRDLARHGRARIESIFERTRVKPGNDKSKGMKGLIKGGNQHLERVDDPRVRDLMLVAHYSRILHYQVAAYDFAADLAESIAHTGDAHTLAALLAEKRQSWEALDQCCGPLGGRQG